MQVQTINTNKLLAPRGKLAKSPIALVGNCFVLWKEILFAIFSISIVGYIKERHKIRYATLTNYMDC